MGGYWQVALAGLPQYELDRVQSVVNAAARLTADARKYDHVTASDGFTLAAGTTTHPV